MRKEAQSLVLLLLGGALLRIGFTGTYGRYVRPEYQWLLILTGLVLAGVAVVNLWQVLRIPVDRDASPAAAAPARQPRAAWLLLAPALVLLLLSPPAMGWYAANAAGTALPAGVAAPSAPLPEGDPVVLSVLDYAVRAADGGRTLSGRRVRLSGFVLAGPAGQPYLARMVIGCCAAGARPVKVGLAGQLPAPLRPDEWLQVEGTYTAKVDRDPLNQAPIPYLQVVSAVVIAAPTNPYT